MQITRLRARSHILTNKGEAQQFLHPLIITSIHVILGLSPVCLDEQGTKGLLECIKIGEYRCTTGLMEISLANLSELSPYNGNGWPCSPILHIHAKFHGGSRLKEIPLHP